MKRFLANASIKYKLMAVVMAAIFMAMLILSVTLIIYDHLTIKSSQVRDLQMLADMVGSNSTAALSFNNPRDATETLSALKIEHHILAGGIYDASGRVFARYTRSGRQNDIFPETAKSAGHQFTDYSLVIFREIMLEGEKIGSVFIEADMEELKSRLNSFITTVVLATLIILAFAFFLVSRMQSVITGPILELAGATRLISDTKDYSIRVQKGNQDELGFLVNKFNEMLEKIENREEELKRAHMELEQRVDERTMELQHEVVQRREAEKQIRASFEEKEVLLKEVHHRVKNNLQIITSLLNLQAYQISDSDTKELFRDSMGRVKSMALIHERLYQSEDLTEINFSDYVESLTRYLLSSTTGNLERISINQDVDGTTLGVDLAVPCGLIINELVTNSMKYAFPNHESGEIMIAFRRTENGTVMLCVSDNGIGIPEHIDIKNTQSLGMQLVQSLTNQIDGELHCDNKHGARFTIEFECEYKKSKEKPCVTA